ncbi:MAG: DUF4416 family protein [Planctomycetota bacterium]|nr:MAG: DUF4416 family protein [Planctomycetota bacterium]
MARRRVPLPAKLICGLFSSERAVIEEGIMRLEGSFGEVDLRGGYYRFTHTDHYAEEMGGELWKCFVSFERLIEQERIVEIKNFTNRLELELRPMGFPYSRAINIDPGYITGAKLVLATMKDFVHRLYLGDGVYGEVTLSYIHGDFRVQPWTYPDYREEENLSFFRQVRFRYLEQFRGGGKGGMKKR